MYNYATPLSQAERIQARLELTSYLGMEGECYVTDVATAATRCP